MRRTNHLPISQYENRLEIIQEEYLQKHFQQIAIVLSKNYHYGFQIIKSLWSLQPTKREKALRIIYKNVRQVIERRKVFAVGSILRKYFESKYSKSKSCVYIASISPSIKHSYKGKQLGFPSYSSNPSIRKSMPSLKSQRKSIFFC